MRGIDPGFFSRELTHSVIETAEQNLDSTAHELVFQACNHAASMYQGSATVVVLKLLEGLKI